MILTPTADQQFFQTTTAKYLDEFAPVSALRRLRDDPVGFEPGYWRGGVELGWTSLLVAEAHGGGSLSDAGLVDLTLVAHEFGAHAAPGPLIPANIVAAALSGSATQLPLLADLLTGARVATWCGLRIGIDGAVTTDISARVDDGDLVLRGTSAPVESAASADVLLVPARTEEGTVHVVVPSSTAGVTAVRLRSVDLTRRFHRVRFDDVRVGRDAVVAEGTAADELVDRQLQLALVLAAAEMVGAMQRGFDMTVEWAFDRYSFGRPLASYQALKHRFADMKAWLEASHAVSDAAAAAVHGGAPDAAELSAAALAFVGDYGAELLQDCVQLHGGIGVTFEHDLHLFLRRHTLDRGLYGTPAAHRQRLAAAVIDRR